MLVVLALIQVTFHMLEAVAAELKVWLVLSMVDPDAEPGPGTTVMRNGEAVKPRNAA